MDPSTEISELIGQKLMKSDGSEVDFSTWYSAFSGKAKYIGLFYGAHWAPPSRLFCKNLKEKFYDVVKGSEEHSGLIEVIFVSDDRELDNFKRNIASMPWLSIPFDQELIKQSLKSKFGVSELPTFAVINAHDGKLVKLEGRQDIFQGVKAFEVWDKIN